jgi:hypothetical protein
MTFPGQAHRVRLLTSLLILCLYVAGLLHWAWFFRYGEMNFQDQDWEKEHCYFTLLRDWVAEGRAPYHTSLPLQGTNRFLALPETMLSPQVLLLQVLDIGAFQPVNTGLMYSLGFLGCLLIRRRYRLGLIPFTMLALLFSCNGYITAHLSVGHSMWNGYFLLSFFALYVLELVDNGGAYRSGLKLAAVLLAMMLQGSFHLVIWCWMFLAVLPLGNRRCFVAIVLAVGFSAWLSFFRLLPAAMSFSNFHRGFTSGYPNATELLHGLITQRDREYPMVGNPLTQRLLRWWEYDVYIGLLGLGLLWYGAIYLRMRAAAPTECRYRALDLPMLVLTFLSLNYLYYFITKLPLPLLQAEIVSSRFVIVPLVILMSLAAICLQRELERVPRTPALYVFLGLALLQTAFDLLTHSSAWRVLPAAAASEVVSDVSFVFREDQRYVNFVYISVLVSLLAVPAWVWAFVRWRPAS